jgi:hypothetical protein
MFASADKASKGSGGVKVPKLTAPGDPTIEGMEPVELPDAAETAPPPAPLPKTSTKGLLDFLLNP